MQRLDQGTLLGCQAWAGTRQRRMVRKVELRPMRGRDTTSHEVAGLAADEDRLVASEKLVVPAIE